MISLQQKAIIADDVLFRKVCGETVVLDLKSENYFGLDEVGSSIWQLLHEHSDLQVVFDNLLAEYDVDAKLLEQELLDFVTKLVKIGIVITKLDK